MFLWKKYVFIIFLSIFTDTSVPNFPTNSVLSGVTQRRALPRYQSKENEDTKYFTLLSRSRTHKRRVYVHTLLRYDGLNLYKMYNNLI